MPAQVSNSYHLQGDGIFSSPSLPRIITGKISQLPLVFIFCGNGIDGERVSAGVDSGWQEGLMGTPLLSSLLPTACTPMGLVLHRHAQ